MVEKQDSDGEALADRHLRVLRALLRNDFLTLPDFRQSLAEAAEAARESVQGRSALVVLLRSDGTLTGTFTDGSVLEDADLSLVASRTLLAGVCQSGEPVLTTVECPLLTRSKSIDRNQIRNVLVVPIRFWKREEGRPTSRTGGCLYVDRSGTEPAFGQADIDSVLDIANLLERTISLLRHASTLEEELTRSLRRLEAQVSEARETFRLHHVSSKDPTFVKDVLEPLKRLARSGGAGLLLTGPTGAGKTHLASSYHYESRRRGGPFVVLDCGQVTSSEALGAELFGFARSSGFNAPREGRPGKAVLADGGTLFIDEIGTLSLDLQQRLLRLLDEGRFTPLGGSGEVRVDVQVVAATNENLADRVREGRFREDLLWRLSEVTVRVPALDERVGDVADLALLFFEKARRRFSREDLVHVDPEALGRLEHIPWSRAGNIRGLEHCLNRSVLLAPEGQGRLTEDDLVLPELGSSPALKALAPRAATPAGRPSAAGAAALKGLLEALIEEHAGVVTKIASDARLVSAYGSETGSVPVSTLRLRLRQLGLEDALQEARTNATLQQAEIISALKKHGSGSGAARALGISRDALVWKLRQAGLTVKQVIGDDGPADL